MHDARDSTSATTPAPDYLALLDRGVQGLKLGVPREYFELDGLDPEVRSAVEAAASAYQKLGATLVPLSLPHTKFALATYYLVAPAEASSNLARYDGVRYGLRVKASSLKEMYLKTRGQGFGAEVKRRIMLGTYALSAGYYDAYYLKAQKVRTLIREDFTAAWQKVDAILSPTAPTTAFRLGEKVDDPLAMYANDVFTLPCNLAGLPGMSLPCGFSKSGLPIGLAASGKALRRGHRAARGPGLRAGPRLRPRATPGGLGRHGHLRLSARHRTRGARAAADQEQNLLWLLHALWRGAQLQHLPGVPGDAGLAARPQREGGGIRGAGRRGLGLPHQHPQHLVAEELLLSRTSPRATKSASTTSRCASTVRWCLTWTGSRSG